MKKLNEQILEFPCECVSAKGGYSDPWAPVAQNKLLPNGTKEKIINLVAQEPRTIAQLAKLLHRSQPSIFTHINEMMASELLRESEEWEKKYPAERYYEPNFPVISAAMREKFEEICNKIAQSFADIFKQNLAQMEQSFLETDLTASGWELKDITQYFYAKAQRSARKMLEDDETLPLPRKHQNGIAWLFWAEEPESNDNKSPDLPDEPT